MEVRIVRSSDVAACAKGSLLPAHYRDDGTCRCGDREAAQAAVAVAEADAALVRERLAAARERLSRT